MRHPIFTDFRILLDMVEKHPVFSDYRILLDMVVVTDGEVCILHGLYIVVVSSTSHRSLHHLYPLRLPTIRYNFSLLKRERKPFSSGIFQTWSRYRNSSNLVRGRKIIIFIGQPHYLIRKINYSRKTALN